MTAEILIVGDPAGRRGLTDAIVARGYEVAICSPRELNRVIRTEAPPAAIIACIGDLEPDVLLAGLRRTRAGASIPVILYGRLGGRLRDLADVLDIGADHFLEEPAGARELDDALAQYAGPPRAHALPIERVEYTHELPPPDPEAGHAHERGRGGTERLASRPRPERERGKALSELQRTLERLDASLRADDPRSDPELAGLGLDGIPDIDTDDVGYAEDEPLVTEIGEHLRGRSPSSSRGRSSSPASTHGGGPVRGDDLTQPSVTPFGRVVRDEPRPRPRVARRDTTDWIERTPSRPAPAPAPAEGREAWRDDYADADDETADSEAGRGDDTRLWNRPDSEGPLRRGRELPGPLISPRSSRASSAVLRARRPDRDGGEDPGQAPSQSPARDPRAPAKPPREPEDPEREAARDRLRALLRPAEADHARGSSRYDPHARGTPWPSDDFDPSESTMVRRERGAATTRRRSLVGGRPPERGPEPPPPSRAEARAPSEPRRGSPEPAREPLPEQPSPWREPDPGAASRGRRASRRDPSRGLLRVDPSLREAGKLGPDLDVPTLLWALHEQRFTGRLRLTRQRIEKQVWLHDGEAVFARSTATSDRLVDGLLRRGVLTRPQYETARRLAAKEPRRAGELLVDAGFLKASELDELLRDHLARVIDSTFVWTDGAWTTEPGERTDEPIQLEVPLAALILDGVRYRCDASEIEDRLTRRAGGPGPLVPRLRVAQGSSPSPGLRGADEGPSLTELIAELGDSFRLLPEEIAWLRRFDGRHGVAALLADGADEQALFALLLTLELAGHVDLRERPEAVVADERDPAQIDRERILERLRLAREADYFELLGVARDAARSEIRQAHAELSATFADDAVEAVSLRRHARELRELRVALDEARDVLVDDAMRSAYLAHLGDE